MSHHPVGMNGHREYLARAVAALTPEGHRRVDELLEQLAALVSDHASLVAFAKARETEADLGTTDIATEPGPTLTDQELDGLIVGFMNIRDQEPLDDVADWANAVWALLQDERRKRRR